MKKKSELICFIPARSGSTRILNKNLKKINNRTLVEITIEHAIKSNLFKRENIILSSDDEKILKLGKKFKINSLKRSKINSKKYSKIENAIIETFNKLNYNIFDKVVLLQPTSPLRKVSTIKKFVKFCISKKLDHCLTVSEIHGNLAKYSSRYFNPINKKRLMTQDIKPFLYENGFSYYFTNKFFSKNGKLYPKSNWNYYITDKYESIDINDKTDLKICKKLKKL
jgi:CMP-N-acetylneuraminic acid synthetase